MAIEIRLAGPADAESIASLIATLGYPADKEAVKERLLACSCGDNRVFVARDNGRAVGFLSFSTIPLFHQKALLGRITAMAIDPRCQRSGVGRKLVAAPERHAAACGCVKMEVTSGDHRELDAHVFYAALGYETDCRRFLKLLDGPPPI